MKLALSFALLTSLGFVGLLSAANDSARVQQPQPVVAPTAADAQTALVMDREAKERAVIELQALVYSKAPGISSRSMAGVAKNPAATLADDGGGGGGVIECGSASGAVTAGSTAMGCGATVEAAIFNAKFDVETNLWADFPGDCQECPNPGRCLSYVSTLDSGWSFTLPFKNGNQWCVKGTYTGAYLFVCEDCF